MSKPQWPPQTAATSDLMGSVVGTLGPIGEYVPLIGVGVYAGHDGWPNVGLRGRVPGDKCVAAGLIW